MPRNIDELKVSAYELGLTRLVGKTVKEIRGYVSNPFVDEPLFKLTKIEFEDGSFLGVEGEHDVPYVVEYGTPQPNMDEDSLQAIYDAENPPEGENE